MKILALAVLLLSTSGSAATPDEQKLEAVYASPRVPQATKDALRKRMQARVDAQAKLDRQRRGRPLSAVPMEPSVSRRLYKTLGGILRRAGAELVVPPDALPADTLVSLSQPHAAQDGARAASLSRAELHGVSRATALGPDAIVLLVPATVTLSYDPDRLNGASEASLKIFAWNQNSGTWEALASKVDPVKKTVKAQTSRLAICRVLAAGSR